LDEPMLESIAPPQANVIAAATAQPVHFLAEAAGCMVERRRLRCEPASGNSISVATAISRLTSETR